MKDRDTLILEHLYLEMLSIPEKDERLRSWLSPGGHFHPCEHHETGLKKHKIAGSYEEAFKKGWARVASSSNYIFLNIEEGNVPTTRQKRAVNYLAQELGMLGVLIDLGEGYRNMWKASAVYESTE